jgi:hypothetical protein
MVINRVQPIAALLGGGYKKPTEQPQQIKKINQSKVPALLRKDKTDNTKTHA